jgi:Emfourin
MLIQFERRGGFAGIRKDTKLNSEAISSKEAKELLELIDKADFFNLSEKFPLPKKGADYFQYRLTIEKEGKKHTVEVTDPAVPATLRPLLQFLSKY